MKNSDKVKALSYIVIGVIIGLVFFVLGDADDAPGLSFIGLVIAFLLSMRGISYTKIIKDGYHIAIILLVFGMLGILFPIILYFDGEISGVSPVVFIGNSLGILLLGSALWRIKRVKNKQVR